MYISVNWLKDYVDLEGVNIENLIDKFTLSCAEVEGIEYKGRDLKNVVVAKIIDVKNHPNSKKLHLLKVDTGNEIFDVVCGAPNVRVGLVTAFAKIGAHVAGMDINKATLGGFDSYGMCCSEHELGISDNHDGIIELEPETPLGVDIKTIYDIEDVIFEIDNKSLTNRPDLWGHYGIAREVAALTGRELKPLKLEDLKNFKGKDIEVDIKSQDCYRYVTATVDNITKKQSSKNMQIRLYYCGMRGINLLADITNYVMLELGQPMHAFDNSIVKKIQVFNLQKDTEFTTLDSNSRVLPEGTMVISTNNTPVAIAGVMGGENSEITDSTTSVLVESANFNGATIRKTALGLGLRTESSARYEKMLDPELTMTALLRYVYLVKSEDGGAKITSNITDVYNYHYPKINVTITKDFIDKYIGIKIPEQKILQILKNLEFDVKVSDKNTYEISVPSFRATKDITSKVDIIEEITRIYGYDNILPKTINQPLQPSKLDRAVALEYDIKYALANRYNLNETHSYIWYDTATNNVLGINPDSVLRCVNSINKENDKIRSTMIPSLLKVIVDNKNTFNKIGTFEIGRIVKAKRQDNLADETKSLGIVLYQKNEDQNNLLLRLKNIIDYLFTNIIKVKYTLVKSKPKCDYYHPVNYYEVVCNESVVGSINLLHPAVKKNIDANCGVAVGEINLSYVQTIQELENKFEKISKFPTTKLDFNFLIPKTLLYKDIFDIANSIQTPLNYKVSLLDIYHNEGDEYISYTLHYEINSFVKNLTSEDIEAFHKQVISIFENKGISLKI